MKAALVAVGILWAVGNLSGETIHFDDVKTGQVPPCWLQGVTSDGTSKWSVEADDTAPSKPNVLVQSAVGTFPWCVLTDAKLADGFVEVKFKPISGKEDQAGGVVWRWKDKNNYYVCRANALEDNVTIYHVIGGNRESFKKKNTVVKSGQWHTLRVEFRGENFVVHYDGQELFKAKDDSIKGAGAVGLWTKADSVTAFDDFSWSSQ